MPATTKRFLSFVLLMLFIIAIRLDMIYMLRKPLAWLPQHSSFAGYTIFLDVVFAMGVVLLLSLIHVFVSSNWKHYHLFQQRYVMTLVLVMLTFGLLAFSDYRQKLLIHRVCAQFKQAVTQEDYETAYHQFMVPTYRNTHSLAKFVQDSNYLGCSRGTQRPYVLYKRGQEASVGAFPNGSLLFINFLEKIDGQWYLTGEGYAMQG